MVENREETLIKLSKIINKFHEEGRLLPENKLQSESNITGEYLKAAEEQLRLLNIANYHEYAGAKYWLPAGIINKFSEGELNTYISDKLTEEKKQEAELRRQQKQKTRESWLKKRKYGFGFPEIKCAGCGKTITLSDQPLYARGSLATRRHGLEALAGSCSCDQCKTQTYYGMFWQTVVGLRWINDKQAIEGASKGVPKEAAIPKEINAVFLKMFQDLKPENKKTKEYKFKVM